MMASVLGGEDEAGGASGSARGELKDDNRNVIAGLHAGRLAADPPCAGAMPRHRSEVVLAGLVGRDAGDALAGGAGDSAVHDELPGLVGLLVAEAVERGLDGGTAGTDASGDTGRRAEVMALAASALGGGFSDHRSALDPRDRARDRGVERVGRDIGEGVAEPRLAHPVEPLDFGGGDVDPNQAVLAYGDLGVPLDPRGVVGAEGEGGGLCGLRGGV